MIDFKKTRLLGHRGARAEALENTLFGFQHANRLQAKGLAGIEFDVQLTADGRLIVFHDDTLQRLCGLQSRIEQLNLTEVQRHTQLGHNIITLDMLAQSSLQLPKLSSKPSLKSAAKPLDDFSASKSTLSSQSLALNRLLGLSNKKPAAINDLTPTEFVTLESIDLNQQPPVPPFDPALAPNLILAPFSHIELEIKTHDRTAYPKLIQALMRDLIDSPLASLPIVLTTFDIQLLAQLQRHKRLSSIARGLLVKEPSLLKAAPNTALQLGCKQLGIYYPLLTQETIKYCHRYHLPVSAWTVNDVDVIKQLVDWQVDVIITDIPTQLL